MDQTKEEFEYDDYGRLKYHPELHPNQGKLFSEDELEYICKFHSADGIASVALGIGRTQTTVAAKLNELKKNDKYKYYRYLDKHYI